MAKARKQEISVRLELEDNLSSGLKNAANEAAKLEKELKGLGGLRSLQTMTRELKEFNREMREGGLKASRAMRTADQDLHKFNKTLKHSTTQAKRLRREFDGLGGEMGGRLVNITKKSSAGFSMLGSAALGAGGAIAGIFAAGKLISAGRGFVAGLAEASGAAQKFQIQLESVKGGADEAAEAYTELSQFAARTPFQLDSLVETSVRLSALTRNSNAAVADIERLGNAAAVTDQPIQELAVHYGRIIEGLKNNTPIGESTMRLNELGIISGDTSRQLRQMIEDGTGPDGIPKFLGEFEKFDGTIGKLSKTIPGLTSTLKDQFAFIQREIGAGGVASGLQSVLEELTGYFTDSQTEISEAAGVLGEEFGGALQDLARDIKEGEIRESLDELVDYFRDPGNRENIRSFFQNIVSAAQLAAKGINLVVKGLGMAGSQLSKNVLAAKLITSGVSYRSGDPLASGFQTIRGADASQSERRAAVAEMTKAAEDLAKYAEILAETKVAGSEAAVAQVYKDLGAAQNVLAKLQTGGADQYAFGGEDMALAQALAESMGRVRRARESYGNFKLRPDVATGAEMDLGPVAVIPGVPATPGTKPGKTLSAKEKEKAEKDAARAAAKLAKELENLKKAEAARVARLAQLREDYGLRGMEATAGRLAGGLESGRAQYAQEVGLSGGTSAASRREFREAEVEASVEAQTRAAAERLRIEEAAALAELEALKAHEWQKNQVRQYYTEQNQDLQRRAAEQTKELLAKDAEAVREYQMAVLGSVGQLAGSLSDIFREGAQENKQLAGLYKATATAESLIATYLAASKALASAPPPANFISAGAVTIAGLANVAKIQSQKFADGGVVGSGFGSVDSVPALLTPGEVVLNAEQQRNLLALANGRGGAGNGSSVVYSPQIPAGMNAEELERVLIEDKERFARVVTDLGLVAGQYRI